MSTQELITKLQQRTVRHLPADWKKGRQCPRCDASTERPKCFFDLGGACPRHDPLEYDDSPYVYLPDTDCVAAAAALLALEARIKDLEERP